MIADKTKANHLISLLFKTLGESLYYPLKFNIYAFVVFFYYLPDSDMIYSLEYIYRSD